MWEAHQKLTELPVSAEQAERMLNEAVKEVKRTVIGRKFIQLYGPMGAGVESVPIDTYRKDEIAEIDLEGKPDPHPIGAHEKERYTRVPIIYKDFVLHWRDVKLCKDHGIPLDVDNAVRAAHQIAHREDALIFNGSKELGIKGMINYNGVKNLKGGDWKKPGNPLKDIYKAVEILLKDNHHFPYALVTSLDMYESILKSVDSPVLEVEQISKICTDGVFYSPTLPALTGIMVSTGPQNFDLAVTEDLHVAYLGPSDMNYKFRVYESLVLRVKRPSSICVITSS